MINNLSNEDYHASEPISSSNCKDLLISPWLYNYKRQNKTEATPAMKFGTMFHSLMLEPKTFDNEYVVADIPKRNTKQGKADYINLEQGYIVDLKTTSSLADDINFSFTTKKYHYDLSASFYVDGFKQATGKDLDFYFIAIETNQPHNYGVYKLSHGLIEQGIGKYTQALEIFAKARERGNFNVPYNGGNLIELVA